MIAAKILADSVSPHGDRLTTLLLTMPRWLLAQLGKHRMLSNSAESGRAKPVNRQIESVLTAPYIPTFAATQPGMVAGPLLEGDAQADAREVWRGATTAMCEFALRLVRHGVHKQWANRLLEPFAFVDVIVTGTEWANFYTLRLSPDAQPEFEVLASLMRAAMDASQPNPLTEGQWHLPLAEPDDAALPIEDQVKVCAARCARVSYGNHLQPKSHTDLLARADALATDRHMSPFEHVATPITTEQHRTMDALAKVAALTIEAPWAASWADSIHYVGNLRGWVSARKMIPGESGRAL